MDGPEIHVDPERLESSLTDIGVMTTRDAGPSDHPTNGRHDEQEVLLDLLVVWEERYRLGENPTPESLGVADPRQIGALRALTARQIRLYSRLQLAKSPAGAAPSAAERLPSFPDHETIDKIGQGGMGVVFKARDQKLGRVVAIKTIAEGQNATADQRERFRAEAQAVARLRHPNIIAIHAIGEHENRPYLSLEFAEGGSLAQKMAKGPTPTGEAALLIESLARAVHAAHEAGIVHRDLKPSNVLLTGEGVPKVSDFGLAKLLDADSARTLSGQVLGSPSYMAPEQAEGRSKQVGPSADIYALGAILYQALTGKPPFLGESALETLKLVVSNEIVSPRRLRPDVPPDLETICLKCLQKEPTRRYASAGALADDLRRFLEGRPILARRATRPERIVLWCRRNPWVAFSIAVLCLGTTVSVWQAIRATVAGRAATRAEAATSKERDRAELSRDRAFRAVQAIVLTDNDQMNTEEARPYRQMLLDVGLTLSREIQQELEGDPRADEVLADALIMQTKILAEKGEYASAEEVAQRAVAMFEGLAAQDQSTGRKSAADHRPGRRDAPSPSGDSGDDIRVELLARLRHYLATVAASGETRRASAALSTEAYRALLVKNPQAPDAKEWIGHIAFNFHNVGDRYIYESRSATKQMRLDLLSKAIGAFEEGVQFCNEYIQGDGQRDVVLSPLAYTERYLCRAYRALGEETTDPAEKARIFKEAVDHGMKSISHFESLVKGNPDHYQNNYDLHQAERELGIVFQTMGRRGEAIQFFTESRETLKSMGKRHAAVVSRTVSIREGLALEDHNLLKVLKSDDPANQEFIEELVAEAYTICEKLDVVRPLSPKLRQAYAFATLLKADAVTRLTDVPDVDLNQKAVQLYETLLAEDPGVHEYRYFLVLCKLELADGLVARGRSAEAKQVETKAMKIVEGDADFCFEVALTFARSAKQTGEGPSKLNSQQRDALKRRYARRVVPLLRAAVAAGFKDKSGVLKDSVFDFFRSDPAFLAIFVDAEFPGDPFVGTEPKSGRM